MPDQRETKALFSFKCKIDKFIEDLDVVDVICLEENLAKLTPPQHIDYPFCGVRHNHIGLSKLKNKSAHRTLVSNHLRQSIYSAFIKDIYEEVTIYLNKVLYECSRNNINPYMLVGNTKIEVNPVDILKCTDIDSVYSHITNLIYKSIEQERSTQALIQKFIKKINIEINQELINSSVSLLNIRHILVHTDGIPNDKFKERNPDIEIRPNGRIKLTYSLSIRIKNAALGLLSAIDKQLIENSIVGDNSIHLNP